MAYKFKRQIFGFMDLLRFKKMVPTREKMLAEGSAEPLPKTFRVNETAKILHPGTRKVKLAEIRDETHDIKTFVFETRRAICVVAREDRGQRCQQTVRDLVVAF